MRIGRHLVLVEEKFPDEPNHLFEILVHKALALATGSLLFLDTEYISTGCVSLDAIEMSVIAPEQNGWGFRINGKTFSPELNEGDRSEKYPTLNRVVKACYNSGDGSYHNNFENLDIRQEKPFNLFLLCEIFRKHYMQAEVLQSADKSMDVVVKVAFTLRGNSGLRPNPMYIHIVQGVKYWVLTTSKTENPEKLCTTCGLQR